MKAYNILCITTDIWAWYSIKGCEKGNDSLCFLRMRTRLELLKATSLKTTGVIQKREDSWTGPEVGH